LPFHRHALFSSGRYEEAVEAYEKGVEVDPTNALMKSGLETARQHAKDNKKPTSPPPSTSRDVGSAADAGMGGLPGMGGGGAGGMPDLSSLMNNPMIAQMAQNMMANGGLDQMMK
jgi:small glutamine-rich tetratricopeptide repeat-containing protein alpha